MALNQCNCTIEKLNNKKKIQAINNLTKQYQTFTADISAESRMLHIW